jgi:hypothetical protein
LIEINTLPGLTPGYSDLCIQAASEGIPYEDLILEILYLGASRSGLLPARVISDFQKKKTGPLNSKANGNGKPANGKQFVLDGRFAKHIEDSLV